MRLFVLVFNQMFKIKIKFMQSDHSFCACKVCYNVVKSVVGTYFILSMYLKNAVSLTSRLQHTYLIYWYQITFSLVNNYSLWIVY